MGEAFVWSWVSYMSDHLARRRGCLCVLVELTRRLVTIKREFSCACLCALACLWVVSRSGPIRSAPRSVIRLHYPVAVRDPSVLTVNTVRHCRSPLLLRPSPQNRSWPPAAYIHTFKTAALWVPSDASKIHDSGEFTVGGFRSEHRAPDRFCWFVHLYLFLQFKLIKDLTTM